MFFVLSKIFWLLAAPSHILLWLMLAGAMASWGGRTRLAGSLVSLAAALFILIGVVPSCRVLLRLSESQYARPDPMPAHVDGILTLGGPNNGLRLVGAYELARKYPQARVVFSGGSGELIDNRPNQDARQAQRFLVALGLDKRRLTLEGRSRNTWENFLFSQRLVKPRPGDVWLLATSALQMPRAMEIAHRLNWPMVAWPTDWQTGAQGDIGYFYIGANLAAFDEAVRELIGRAVYRWSGKARPF